MKTFKQHFREASDPNDPKVIVAQAKAILDQNKKDKELFAASIKKLEGNKAAKRIKYSQFNAERLQNGSNIRSSMPIHLSKP
jgi:hypothetical protein